MSSSPKHLRNIELKLLNQLKAVKKPTSELLEKQQIYYDSLLAVHQEAFQELINNTKTYSKILNDVKKSYEYSLEIRDKRITQFIIQDKVFGITAAKEKRDKTIQTLIENNDELKEKNFKLILEVSKLKKDIAKLEGAHFSEYLSLARERDARYALYSENMALHLKLKALEGSAEPTDKAGDPLVLRIALNNCRALLSKTQWELNTQKIEYADTVPRREHDALLTQHAELGKRLGAVNTELEALHDNYKRISTQKKNLEEELLDVKERCSELERAGTPRPHWEICADFIGGGRDRWLQLANGLSSRDILRVLLKELGPAAENENLEHFDGLGTDPSIPPYLRYSGKVRNLRLSRRDVSIVINDIWQGKALHPDMNMQDYVTKYFEDRYQQASMRAEWAYNVCASAERMLDEPHVKLFWGVLHGQLSEHIYWGLRADWARLRDNMYARARGHEIISLDEFEKVCKATFPLKSEVDIKELLDVVRKQLKLKLNNTDVNLDKVFYEGSEGWCQAPLARDLRRARRGEQARHVRHVVHALAERRRADRVSVAALKRAFAIVDPAIDHIRMERYLRWTFDTQTDLDDEVSMPFHRVAARLAAGDIERVGPRIAAARRHKKYH